MITPKFDPATPLHRTAMRTQKAGRLIFFFLVVEIMIQNLRFYMLFSHGSFAESKWQSSALKVSIIMIDNRYSHLKAGGMSKNFGEDVYVSFLKKNIANLKCQEVEIC